MRFGGGGGNGGGLPFGFEDVGAGEEDKEEHGPESSSDAEEDLEAKAERLRRSLGASTSSDRGGNQPERGGLGKRNRGAAVGSSRQPLRPSKEELEELDAALDGEGNGGAPSFVPRAGLTSTMDHRNLKLGAATASAHRALIMHQGLFEGSGRAAVGAPQAGSDTAKAPAAEFMAAKAFCGSKPGFVFRKGPKGLGYYPDPLQPQGKSLAAAGGSVGGVIVVAGSAVLPAAAKPQPQQQLHQKQRKGLGDIVASDLMGGRGAGDDDDGGGDNDDPGDNPRRPEGMRPVPGNKAAAQREMISMAFAGEYLLYN